MKQSPWQHQLCHIRIAEKKLNFSSVTEVMITLRRSQSDNLKDDVTNRGR